MKTIYVLTIFENLAWGQRSPDNEMKYGNTIVFKTEKGCNKFINKYLSAETLKVSKGRESFDNSFRRVDVQVIGVSAQYV